MSVRPVPARWFELVTTSAHVAPALDALARTGAIELEARRDDTAPLLLPDITDLLRKFHDTARRYGDYWPEAKSSGGKGGDVRRLLESASGRISAWQAGAAAEIESLEAGLRTLTELRELALALSALGDEFPAPGPLAGAGPQLAARLYRLPPETPPPAMPKGLVTRQWPREHGFYILIVGRMAAVDDYSQTVLRLKGQVVPLPTWLPATVAEARTEVENRKAAIEDEIARLSGALAQIARQHQLAEAIGDFRLIEWLGEHAGEISAGSSLAHITGWSAELGGGDLAAALAGRGVPGLVRLMPEPAGAVAPLVLRNPRWARAFEMFARMMGMPTRSEADPSMIVAFVAPVLFGFMFGDVGHGLVLMAVGLRFGAAMPVLRLLVPGGAMAALFGILFGSVFCVETLIPALWLHPLHEPVTLLVVALAGGIAILMIGVAIDAVQAGWRGSATAWWGHEAGLVLTYVSLLASLAWSPALWGAVAGAAWYVLGAAIVKARLSAAGVALAELVEHLIQILVNTVSFSRVGAFALAHAGLAAAVVGIAEVAGGAGYWIVLLFGNLLVLALEGLVVGIQTTRLVLFEFFIRFFAGGGRVFKPLTPPPGTTVQLPTQIERP